MKNLFGIKKRIWIVAVTTILGCTTGMWYIVKNKVPKFLAPQDYAMGTATITKMTPQGNVDNLYQTLVVLYSKPMVPLASLSEKDNLPCPISITPKTEGICKRISSRALEFTPKTHREGATKYQAKTIQVKGLLNQIKKDEVIDFITTPLDVHTPQYISPKEGIELVMNFPVDIQSLRTKTQLMYKGKFQAVNIEPIDKNATHFHITLAQGSLLYDQQYALQINQ